MTYLTRRRFFLALAASAVAAGVPLAIGFPRKLREPDKFWHSLTGRWVIWVDDNRVPGDIKPGELIKITWNENKQAYVLSGNASRVSRAFRRAT